MAANLSVLYDSAESLCSHSWCPACAGVVEPAVELTDLELILCPCTNCGYMLICKSLGVAGEYLTRPDDELWQSIVALHGRTVRSLQRSINLREDHVCVYTDEGSPAAERGEPLKFREDWPVFALLAAAAAAYVGVVFLAAKITGKL